MDAILHTVNAMEVSGRKKEDHTVLLMDVKGAFDNVSKTALLSTLNHFGLPGNLLAWVDNFMSDRRTTLSFDGRSDASLPVKTGIPQGSPVSPILFLLYVRPLFDIIEQKHPLILTRSYIDDIKLSIGGDPVDNVHELKETTITVNQWAK